MSYIVFPRKKGNVLITHINGRNTVLETQDGQAKTLANGIDLRVLVMVTNMLKLKNIENLTKKIA